LSSKYSNIIFQTAVIIVIAAAGQWSARAENDKELIATALAIFGALPELMASSQNQVTPEKVRLGRVLFFEPRISNDGTVSCSRCHLLGLYGTDALPYAIGNLCKVNPRNAPTVFNAAAQISAHWIGNRASAEDQARQALVGPPSFGMPSYDSAMDVLKSIPGYLMLFKAAFPKAATPVSPENFALAIGAFERTLVTPAPFDTFVRGDGSALTAGQKTGMRDFITIGCAGCHGGPYVGGQSYKKFGQTVPYWKLTNSKSNDLGRFIVTGDESDKYVFKVPVLRNVAMTAPYFHDGSVGTLAGAVQIMAKAQLNKGLEDKEMSGIVDFLGALTGTIPAKDLVVPILPPVNVRLDSESK
jgi:cytochrome c peroxidase